jgi:hypothetical protein
MTKTEYKAVKCAWARAVNNKENKPYKDAMYGTKYDGKLNALHFMVYNIIRGFPSHRGFEQEKRGFIEAGRKLDFYLKFDREEQLLFPFENLVTLETFKELVK